MLNSIGHYLFVSTNTHWCVIFAVYYCKMTGVYCDLTVVIPAYYGDLAVCFCKITILNTVKAHYITVMLQ